MALADAAPQRKGGYQNCVTCGFLKTIPADEAAALTQWLNDRASFSARAIAERIASDPDYADKDTPGQSSIGKHRRENHGTD